MIKHNYVFIADGARIVGDIEIDANYSIWFNAVLRRDNGKIKTGRHTNVQDNVVLHANKNEL